jgi:imidazolonepropionase-like amidohydrolase
VFKARIVMVGIAASVALTHAAPAGPPASGAAAGASGTSAPETSAYVIRNARIVPVSGPAIDQGTIVISDGLIKAVGASVTVPADAWVIEGKGLTVYPGLIDALTDLGLGAPAAAAGGPAGVRPGGGSVTDAPRPARGPQDRPASTPWVQAADDLKPDDRRIESWRNAGFTSALTAPRAGIFPGQGAVINLAGERAGDLVVASPATFQVNLQPAGGFGGFPGSLMGVISYVRQIYLDVQHDTDARKQYDAGPRGLERPDYDRTVRAVSDALAAKRPVLLPAGTAVQIARALDLAQELKLRPVLYGVQEGYRAADRLSARKAPVLVSLKWPERDASGDPDADESLRVLRLRDKAPSTPGVLQKAGVKFAFYSDGAQPQDLLKNARKAVDAGLPADAAVRAFTLDAADILGVSDRLGSLEAGKIANLVITDGDLLAEKTKVKFVFVDGRKFEPREMPPAPGRGGDTPPPTAAGSAAAGGAAGNAVSSMAGKWSITANTPQGTQACSVDMTMAAGGALSGAFTSPYGTSTASGTLTGASFTFSTTITVDGRPIAITFSGTLDGNSIKGTMTTSSFTGDFTGTRPAARASQEQR